MSTTNEISPRNFENSRSKLSFFIRDKISIVGTVADPVRGSNVTSLFEKKAYSKNRALFLD